MQLLLAVRVAFAIEAEKGRTPLPLFLDEALTTADPDRFRAVADSLRRLSEEDGRQIFYLTAQPEEGRYWAEAAPAVIDLAASRRAGRAVTIPEEVGLPPAAPEPPHPGGLRPEEYAVRIGVDPVQPWGPPDGLHVFHFLRDDLELLRRLLRASVEHLGPLASLLDSDEAGCSSHRTSSPLSACGPRAHGRGSRRGERVEAGPSTATCSPHPAPSPCTSSIASRSLPARWTATRGGCCTPWTRERSSTSGAGTGNGWRNGSGRTPTSATPTPLDARGHERRVAMALTAHGSPPGASLAEAAELARSMGAGLAAGHKGGRPVTDPAAPSGTEGS